MLDEVLNITDTVLHLLKIDPKCRDSDRRLIVKVWEIQNEDLSYGISFKEFSSDFRRGGYASTESIRRSRQKIQEHNPELRGRNYEIRQELEKEMREGIVNMDVSMKEPEIRPLNQIEAYNLLHQA